MKLLADVSTILKIIVICALIGFVAGSCATKAVLDRGVPRPHTTVQELAADRAARPR